MTAGKICHATADGICVIRMEGRLTFTLGVAFGLFIDGLFDDGAVRDAVVDMSQAAYLDSTMLGLLGRMANEANRRWHRKITIAAPSEDVRLLLTNIGFDDVFIFLNDRIGGDPDLREIPLTESGEAARLHMIRDAHRTLMEMNEANAVRFRNVVDVLDHEIGIAERPRPTEF